MAMHFSITHLKCSFITLTTRNVIEFDSDIVNVRCHCLLWLPLSHLPFLELFLMQQNVIHIRMMINSWRVYKMYNDEIRNLSELCVLNSFLTLKLLCGTRKEVWWMVNFASKGFSFFFQSLSVYNQSISNCKILVNFGNLNRSIENSLSNFIVENLLYRFSIVSMKKKGEKRKTLIKLQTHNFLNYLKLHICVCAQVKIRVLSIKVKWDGKRMSYAYASLY